MRVNKKLLEELKARKQVPRESYADVVKRMIDKEIKPKKMPKGLTAWERENWREMN